MSDGWKTWLAERPLGVIATTGAGGLPHAVPVEVVVADGLVYSWCERIAARVANIERTGVAALVAYKGDSFVLVRGRARVLDHSEPIYAGISQMFLDKYKRTEAYGNDMLIEITPDKISARI